MYKCITEPEKYPLLEDIFLNVTIYYKIKNKDLQFKIDVLRWEGSDNQILTNLLKPET